MTDKTGMPKNDSSDRTVIGFKGSEQHHDLKDKSGEKTAHKDKSSSDTSGTDKAAEKD